MTLQCQASVSRIEDGEDSCYELLFETVDSKGKVIPRLTIRIELEDEIFEKFKREINNV